MYDMASVTYLPTEVMLVRVDEQRRLISAFHVQNIGSVASAVSDGRHDVSRDVHSGYSEGGVRGAQPPAPI